MNKETILNSVKTLYKASNRYHHAGTALAICAGAEVCLTVYSLYKAKKAKSEREFKDWVMTASLCGIQGLGVMILSGICDTQSFILGGLATTTSGQVAIFDAIGQVAILNAVKTIKA